MYSDDIYLCVIIEVCCDTANQLTIENMHANKLSFHLHKAHDMLKVKGRH